MDPAVAVPGLGAGLYIIWSPQSLPWISCASVYLASAAPTRDGKMVIHSLGLVAVCFCAPARMFPSLFTHHPLISVRVAHVLIGWVPPVDRRYAVGPGLRAGDAGRCRCRPTGPGRPHPGFCVGVAAAVGVGVAVAEVPGASTTMSVDSTLCEYSVGGVSLGAVDGEPVFATYLQGSIDVPALVQVREPFGDVFVALLVAVDAGGGEGEVQEIGGELLSGCRSGGTQTAVVGLGNGRRCARGPVCRVFVGFWLSCWSASVNPSGA